MLMLDKRGNPSNKVCGIILIPRATLLNQLVEVGKVAAKVINCASKITTKSLLTLLKITTKILLACLEVMLKHHCMVDHAANFFSVAT